MRSFDTPNSAKRLTQKNAAANGRHLIYFGKLLTVSILLTSCGSAPQLGAINMACASIEGYQSTKALSLVDAVNGGSASESVDLFITPMREGVLMDSTATSIFDSYASSMSTWGRTVDISLKSGMDFGFAAEVLEKNIDSLAARCEDAGWKFKAGWR
jgi:hypothetical protein